MDPGPSWISLETGISGGNCGNGGRDGGRGKVVTEWREVAELTLLRRPKAADEAREIHAEFLQYCWKLLA